MSEDVRDSAAASVLVSVPPEVAFDVFTREIDLWWRQGPRFRIAGKQRGQLNFEPGLGGRLFETFEEPKGARTFEVGRVTGWEPPSRIDLEWRGVNYKPKEKTWVTVRFEKTASGTLVSVRHGGWNALPMDHPARHGLQGGPFYRMIGLHWGDLMSAFREHVALRKA
jgi:uncharacterized protein YndB with AHSA1/START domain